MSAFIPMRGRKDSRDTVVWSDTPQPQEEATSFQRAGGGDLDDATIAHLISSQLWPAQTLVRLANGQQLVPRQFANQLAMQQQRLGGSRPTLLAVPYSREELGAETMVQTKPRRAFQPMRGKKSAGEAAQLFAWAPLDEETSL